MFWASVVSCKIIGPFMHDDDIKINAEKYSNCLYKRWTQSRSFKRNCIFMLDIAISHYAKLIC